MAYLALAFISSALVSIVMRMSSAKVKNNMVMFMANYAMCLLLSVLCGMRIDTAAFREGVGFAIGIGILSGVLYLAGFLLLQINVRKNGVVLSSTFMKLGVLVPTIMAVVFFGEKPGVSTIIGFIIALIAIVLINTDGSDDRVASRGRILLPLLLLVGGFTDSLANVFEKLGVSGQKDLYLACTFLVALLCSAALKVYRKQKLTAGDLLWGLLIGIPNYFSSRFLLLALSDVPAIIAYPVYNIGGILLVTCAGVLAFGERPGRRKYIALAMILIALVLLNL